MKKDLFQNLLPVGKLSFRLLSQAVVPSFCKRKRFTLPGISQNVLVQCPCDTHALFPEVLEKVQLTAVLTRATIVSLKLNGKWFTSLLSKRNSYIGKPNESTRHRLGKVVYEEREQPQTYFLLGVFSTSRETHEIV